MASLGQTLGGDWAWGSSRKDARLPFQGCPEPRAPRAELGGQSRPGPTAPSGRDAVSQTPQEMVDEAPSSPRWGRPAPAVPGCPGSLAPSVAVTSTCPASPQAPGEHSPEVAGHARGLEPWAAEPNEGV